MPIYDSPLSAWPGIITLLLGLLILAYLIARMIREYRTALGKNKKHVATKATSAEPRKDTDPPAS